MASKSVIRGKSTEILAAILVGGASQRMGQNKAEIPLAGETLLDRVLGRLRSQVSEVVLVGGDCNPASEKDLVFLQDAFPDRRGPLSGILATLEWAIQTKIEVSHLFICAVDMPFLPGNIVSKLADQIGSKDVVFPVESGQVQYMSGLWSPNLAGLLRTWLEASTTGSIRDFAATVDALNIDVAELRLSPTQGSFLNVNSPEELNAAERQILADRNRS